MRPNNCVWRIRELDLPGNRFTNPFPLLSQRLSVHHRPSICMRRLSSTPKDVWTSITAIDRGASSVTLVSFSIWSPCATSINNFPQRSPSLGRIASEAPTICNSLSPISIIWWSRGTNDWRPRFSTTSIRIEVAAGRTGKSGRCWRESRRCRWTGQRSDISRKSLRIAVILESEKVEEGYTRKIRKKWRWWMSTRDILIHQLWVYMEKEIDLCNFAIWSFMFTQPHVSKELVVSCTSLADTLRAHFGRRPRFQHTLDTTNTANSKSAMRNSHFVMLTSNVTQVIEALDQLRQAQRF